MGKRLNKITFTGMDKCTGKNDLVKISKEFPAVECGEFAGKALECKGGYYD